MHHRIKTLSLVLLSTFTLSQQGLASYDDSSSTASGLPLTTMTRAGNSLSQASAEIENIEEFVRRHSTELQASFEVGVSLCTTAATIAAAIETMNYPLLMALATEALVVHTVVRQARARTAQEVLDRRLTQAISIRLAYVRNFRDILAEQLQLRSLIDIGQNLNNEHLANNRS